MTRFLLALILSLALPAAAHARPGDPDRRFGRQGTVTLKAPDTDAVGGAVKAISGNRVLAGGSAGGQFVVVRLRPSGALDRRFGTSGQVVPALPGTSLEGVRALATFRDGRIVAAGTLRLANGTSKFVAVRLLPTGEIDPSFGAGFGYVLAGPDDAQLGAMAMDRNGNVILAGSRPSGAGAEVPIVMRLLPDGTPDPAFATAGTFEGAPLGLGGRVTGILLRPEGPILLSVGGSAGHAYPAVFTVVRLGPTGAPDPTFGGTGIVNVALGAGSGAGIGAQAIHGGPDGTALIAGTDLTATSTPRGAIIRVRADGALDTRFGQRGVARVARSGDDIRITGMARDGQGRILLSGSGRAPNALVVRLRGNGARDRSFGNGGLRFPLLGRPPGGDPIFTTFDAIDAAGSRAVIAGSAAGPGLLRRSESGTLYTGRFALTVSKLL